MRRQLFLIGYDIVAASRRRRVLRALKGHAVGGQKSLYECWLDGRELERALAQLEALIDPDEDRLVVVRLDPTARVHTLGRAVEPSDGEFFYQG